MNEEELKIHRDNNTWISHWLMMCELGQQLAQTNGSAEYTELNARYEALTKSLQAEFETYSPERQKLIRNLKQSCRQIETATSARKKRQERIATTLMPLLIQVHGTTQAPEVIADALDLANHLIDAIDDKDNA